MNFEYSTVPHKDLLSNYTLGSCPGTEDSVVINTTFYERVNEHT